MEKKIIALLMAVLLALGAPAMAATKLEAVETDDMEVFEEFDEIEPEGDGVDPSVLDVSDILDLNEDEGPRTMYVTASNVKVYAKRTTKSKALLKLKKGQEVIVEQESASGTWYGITVDKELYGQYIGWVLAEYLESEEDGGIGGDIGGLDGEGEEECSHQWTRWGIDVEPTCVDTGRRSRVCLLCGLTEEETLGTVDHAFGKWKVVRESTCTKSGQKVRTCTVCGEKESRAIDKLPHDYGNWITDREPTCTKEGQRSRVCKVCGHEDARAIEKLPHNYGGWKVTLEATDHSAGEQTRTCTVCGNAQTQPFDPEGTLRRGARGDAVREVQQLLADQGYLKAGGVDGIFGAGMERAVIQFQKDQGLNADGVVWPQTLKRLRHDYGVWETLLPLTRDTDGVRVRTCKDCGYTQREVIPAGVTYERKQRGEEIRTLQTLLNDLGYSAGTADGIYGQKLDNAFAAFAADQYLDFTPGLLTPSDVDELVNAWIAAQDASMLRLPGERSAAVNLVLTVNAVSEGAGDDMRTYEWTLTNMGSEKCRFNALLLGYGEGPDFMADNLVMQVGNCELKANGANNASGSFSVAADWGAGKLNFCAVGTSLKTGLRWFSNVRTGAALASEQQQPQSPIFFEQGRTIEPIDASVNVNALADGLYPVAFDRGDVAKLSSGVFMNAVHIYTLDLYDAADIEALAAGDTVMVSGEATQVSSVSRSNGRVSVNGGPSAMDGLDFVATEDGSYRVSMFDDAATYTEQGLTTLTLAPSAVFEDHSGDKALPAIYAYADIARAIAEADYPAFTQFNTQVQIASGKVTKLIRNYLA